MSNLLTSESSAHKADGAASISRHFTADLFAGEDNTFLQIIQNIPAAVYTTDAEGRITFYNEAAAALWGRHPKLGEDWWCGSWRLYWPDGTPMAHGDCPMGIALKTGQPVRGQEAVAERPDGTRYPFIAYPSPLRNTAGKLVGAVNMLVDITERKRNEEAAQRLSAVVECADDAIISKDLNGVITSWNSAAERLFGYKAEEILGRPVTTLIPHDRHDEEPSILESLRRGERIDHYETIRQRKDGSLIEISLTVSPVKDASGKIIGASKIARDISDRKRQQETKDLLLNEMQHRIRNTLSTVQAIATQTFRTAPDHERRSFSGRIQTMASAHDVLTRQHADRAAVSDVVQNALAPFLETDRERIQMSGPHFLLHESRVLGLSMVLHELSTNAIKYGGLSNEDGRVAVTWELTGQGTKLRLRWQESNGPTVEAPQRKGFGSTLIERMLRSEGGDAHLEFAEQGVTCVLEIPI